MSFYFCFVFGLLLVSIIFLSHRGFFTVKLSPVIFSLLLSYYYMDYSILFHGRFIKILVPFIRSYYFHLNSVMSLKQYRLGVMCLKISYEVRLPFDGAYLSVSMSFLTSHFILYLYTYLDSFD